MNELYAIEKTTLTAIGDVIRESDGYIIKGDYTPENMPVAIRSNYDKKWQEGHEEGYSEGYNTGRAEGKAEGKIEGYFEGVSAGQSAEQQITDGIITREATSYVNDRITTTGVGVFRGYSNLRSVRFDNVITMNSATFHSCTGLTKAEFGKLKSISANDFYGCSSLTALIIRTPSVCSLSNTNALNNTPIASGTGSVYVPDNLVASYKGATNWSAYANSIKPISEYTGG